VPKRREEIEAVAKMLPAYNRLHGTDYREVVSGEDGRGVDVVAKSRRDEPTIDFQVTFIDGDGRLRASISTGIPRVVHSGPRRDPPKSQSVHIRVWAKMG
jgi:hypothetical protein